MKSNYALILQLKITFQNNQAQHLKYRIQLYH